MLSRLERGKKSMILWAQSCISSSIAINKHHPAPCRHQTPPQTQRCKQHLQWRDMIAILFEFGWLKIGIGGWSSTCTVASLMVLYDERANKERAATYVLRGQAELRKAQTWLDDVRCFSRSGNAGKPQARRGVNQGRKTGNACLGEGRRCSRMIIELRIMSRMKPNCISSLTWYDYLLILWIIYSFIEFFLQQFLFQLIIVTIHGRCHRLTEEVLVQ